MTLREFLRFHLLKALLAFVALQVIIIAIVQNYNHRPLAQRDQANVIEGRTVKITPLSNDSDKDDNEELSVLNVFSPISGSVEQNKNLLFYTPEPGFTGVDSFAYTITDGDKESKEGFIIIQVNKNLEPVAKSDSIGIYVGGSTFIDVLSNDEDREDDSIFIKDFTDPLYGKAKLAGDKFIYSASNSISHPDSFHYVISDGRSNAQQVSVFINVKSKNDPCYPWLSTDIGDVAISGSFKCINKTFVIEASGGDIWNNTDEFHYAYQYISGDCEMLTKVDSMEANHEWAKAAIMVRETLGGGSKVSMVLLSNKNGATYHNRFEINDSMEGSDRHPEAKAPYWLKLIRKGDAFTYFISDNGIHWKKIGSEKNPMSKNVCIGFAVTSHNNNELAKVIFSNFRLKAEILNITDSMGK